MNSISRPTETCNPYAPPQELPSVLAAARRRFLVSLIPAFLVAAVGAVATASVALSAPGPSVLLSLLPTAFSLALSIWLVCHRFARTAPAGRVVVVLFGSILSVAATGCSLDNPFPSVVTNAYGQSAVASILGATVFAASLSLSRISLFSVTLTFIAWFVFEAAMFSTLAFFILIGAGSNLAICIFACATFFQTIVVSTIAMYINDAAILAKDNKLPNIVQ